MHIGQTFALTRDVFVIDVNDGRPFFDHPFCLPDLWVDVPGEEFWVSPLPTIAQWEQTHSPSKIRGVIKAGAIVSLDKIVYDSHVDDDSVYYVFNVVDGAFRHSSICVNELMERRSYLYRAPKPENMRSVQ